MVVLTLSQVAKATGGRLIGDPARSIESVTTDSRGDVRGALFVALKGERFDGHAFVRKALGHGASAALVSDADSHSSASELGSAVVVDDTLVALQDLASFHRQQMGATVAALTGSAGKTTTKELVGTILNAVAPTLKTRGNLNNHIGVPLTLLRLESSHRYAVIEMGCNGFGEIERLTKIAGPTVGLITNVGEAHLEGLGDLDGVARAKGELFENLPTEGTAVVNADDDRVRERFSPAKRRITYGMADGADVRLIGRHIEPDGRQRLEITLAGSGVCNPALALLGKHNATNALAAAALAVALGVSGDDIERGLSSAQPAPGRLALCAGIGGTVVIDDSYNANPTALVAALDVLAEHRRNGEVAIHALLGEMLELGPESSAHHERIGRYAAGLGLKTLVSSGAAARAYGLGAAVGGMEESQIYAVETPEEAASLVLDRASEGDVILVKGSRGAQMEGAVRTLCEGVEEGGHEGAP